MIRRTPLAPEMRASPAGLRPIPRLVASTMVPPPARPKRLTSSMAVSMLSSWQLS